MKRKNKGFTLIELLAVIVILGLLMAIAIPSVTKYITQSRKKTVSTTIDNYMSALTNQVNDMEYIFTATNTIYAVPIECIALERGGTNPFGEWLHANSKYWAYVLVQYDDKTSSYTYGFTFKDSAGYGLYPTTSEKLKESGTQILTDLDLTKPINGTITNITAKENWVGFNIEEDTNLVVLDAENEGITGNGTTTCTLCQKGNNYEKVKQEIQSEEEKKDAMLYVGNELCLGGECFYVIENNKSTVTFIPKYMITTSTTNPQQTTSSYSQFSKEGYWRHNKENYLSKVEYQGYIFYTYPGYVYDSNSILYQYVEAYEKHIKETYGFKSANAKLISYEQLMALGCTSTSCSNAPSWLRGDSGYFWTGIASNDGNIYIVGYNGHFDATSCEDSRGLRPTITISKSEINFN